MKAFSVTEEFENTGGIIFAKSAVAARRIGADTYADGDFSAVSCRRAPWADTYHGQPLPASAMVAHGWHFECSGCGQRIDDDMLFERGIEYCDVVGVQDGCVYCTPVCEAKDRLHQAQRKWVETRWLRRLAKIVKRRFPDAVPLHAHAFASTCRRGHVRIQQAAVQFDFPGRQGALAELKINRGLAHGTDKEKRGRPCWWVSVIDKDAFEAYARETRDRVP